MAYDNPDDDVPLWKVIVTDLAGVVCLILVPFLGPLPGPGGIPLTIAGLGLLARNHEWAQNWLHYVKKHSDSLRDVLFPNNTVIKWGWDILALLLMAVGTWGSFVFDGNRLLKAFSIGLMASSTTVFMMNRNRIAILDKKLRGNRKKG